MFERFTDRARKVMALANRQAQRFNHEYIGTEHMLLGLIEEGSGVGANVLKLLDVNLQQIRAEVEKLVKPGPKSMCIGKLPQTPQAKKVIEYAIEEARSLNHNYVGTEHLLLGLLRESEGVAAQVLRNLGLKFEEVRGEVLSLLGGATYSLRGGQPSIAEWTDRTWRAEKVLLQAIEEARQLKHAYIETEHLLLALASADVPVITKLGIEPERIRQEVTRIVQPGAQAATQTPVEAPGMQRLLAQARREALGARAERMDSKHLLLGLLDEPDSVAALVLRNLGFDLGDLRKRVLELPG